jgi:hypothetical protein
MGNTDLTFIEKIVTIQSELYVTKSQWNDFGKYSYRSTEDILYALKPLLRCHKLMITITDDIVLIGDRYYVKAAITITDGKESISNSALARESLIKKGMDDSQITGATSSYARKYALAGMFGIDDEKDADTRKPETIDSDKFSGKRPNASDFVINYGKEIRGKTMEQAGEKSVRGLLNWFLEKHEKEKTIPAKGEQEFIDRAREFLR